MDEVRIRTKFVKSILSKMITHAVNKFLGTDIDFYLNDSDLEFMSNEWGGEQTGTIHLDIEISFNGNDISKLIERLGEFNEK